MTRTIIAVDNGCTGTLAFVDSDGKYEMVKTPFKYGLDYTKHAKKISRIDVDAMTAIFKLWKTANCIVLCERPLVNPMLFKATISAVRAYEATLVAIESVGLPYDMVDSRSWQKEFLPSGLKGRPVLKEASLQAGKRLFPNVDWDKFDDADSILMAEWGRRNNK